MFRLESIYIYKTNVTLDAKVFLLQVKGGKKEHNIKQLVLLA